MRTLVPPQALSNCRRSFILIWPRGRRPISHFYFREGLAFATPLIAVWNISHSPYGLHKRPEREDMDDAHC